MTQQQKMQEIDYKLSTESPGKVKSLKHKNLSFFKESCSILASFSHSAMLHFHEYSNYATMSNESDKTACTCVLWFI